MTGTFDAVVVGLGAMGSATVYELARRGINVLGIDMFSPGHKHGSSHGPHRMIRKSPYGMITKGVVQHGGYVPLAIDAFERWQRLEEETGRDLMRIIGEIRMTDAATHELPAPSSGVFIEPIDAATMAERFPGFRMPDGMIAGYEAEAGYLRPEACIQTHLDLATQGGATLNFEEEVLSWTVDGDGVEIRTSTGSYRADRAVITTGPWASELLADLRLPVAPTRIVNAYFEPSRPDLWSADSGAPGFVLGLPEGTFFGVPACDGGGLKIGRHDSVEITTPRTIRREVDPGEIETFRTVMDRYMPGASGELVNTDTCMYTNTIDLDWILDRHPAHRQVIFACGFSGRGFKFSGIVGQVLAELATDLPPSYDIAFMRLDRFNAA